MQNGREGLARAVSAALVWFAGAATCCAGELGAVECEGVYAKHLQGVCAGDDALYWCFTTELVKTDLVGRVLRQAPVGDHHGDLCLVDGRVYVAVNFGEFNDAAGKADSWVYVYQAGDLSLAARHHVPEVFHGAGGIAHHEGRFIVVGGLPPGVEENYAYEYDEQFRFVRKHTLATRYTLMGIQTAAYADGHWWFGCYGTPPSLLKADEALQRVQRFEFDCSLGIVPVSPGRFLVARGGKPTPTTHTGRLVRADADPQRGLTAPGTSAE